MGERIRRVLAVAGRKGASAASTMCARARPASTVRTWPVDRSASTAAEAVDIRSQVDRQHPDTRAEVSSSLR